MTSPQDATEVVPYFTSAATVALIQKYLKSRPEYATFVRAFPGADRYAHWFVAGVGSALAAAGIHITWNYDWSTGGEFHGYIPAAVVILHGLGDFYKVYIMQHVVYLLAHEEPYNPPPAPPAGGANL